MNKETTRRREDNLRWLLAFAQHTLPPVKSEGFKAVREAIKGIVVVEVVGARTLFPKRMFKLIRSGGMQKAFELTHDTADREGNIVEARLRTQFRLPTDAEVRKLQKWVVSLMEMARPKDMELAPTITESGEVEERVILPINYVPSSRPVHLMQTDTFRRLAFYKDTDLYREASVALLAAFADRLLHCEDETCRRLFYRKGRKRFCSVLCAQRVRSRNWYRENKGVVSERQHGAYHRRMQRELHPKVVVRRRKKD